MEKISVGKGRRVEIYLYSPVYYAGQPVKMDENAQLYANTRYDFRGAVVSRSEVKKTWEQDRLTTFLDSMKSLMENKYQMDLTTTIKAPVLLSEMARRNHYGEEIQKKHVLYVGAKVILLIQFIMH